MLLVLSAIFKIKESEKHKSEMASCTIILRHKNEWKRKKEMFFSWDQNVGKAIAEDHMRKLS